MDGTLAVALEVGGISTFGKSRYRSSLPVSPVETELIKRSAVYLQYSNVIAPFLWFKRRFEVDD